MRVVICDYCGNTYGDTECWCPHCLAPRPIRDKPMHVENDFYADNVVYRIPTNNEVRLLMPSTYGTTKRR